MGKQANLVRLLRARSDTEVMTLYSRLIIRVMTVRPVLGDIVGSLESMRSIVTQLLGSKAAVLAEDEEREADVVRAVLLDATGQEELADMLVDATRAGTDTVLEAVTDQPGLAGIVMVMLTHLEIDFEDRSVRTGLQATVPQKRVTRENLRNTIGALR